jgi:hypothetical protein
VWQQIEPHIGKDVRFKFQKGKKAGAKKDIPGSFYWSEFDHKGKPDLAVEGANKIHQEGLTDYAEWSKAMTKEFGDDASNRLSDLWRRAQAIAKNMAKREDEINKAINRTGSDYVARRETPSGVTYEAASEEERQRWYDEWTVPRKTRNADTDSTTDRTTGRGRISDNKGSPFRGIGTDEVKLKRNGQEKVTSIGKLKQEANKMNDDLMLDFFQTMIDEYGLTSTAQEIYDKTFKGEKNTERKQTIIKETLRHQYVAWESLQSEMPQAEVEEKRVEAYGKIKPQYNEHKQGEAANPRELDSINIDYIRDLPEGLRVPNPEYVIHVFDLAKKLDSPARYKELQDALSAFTGSGIELQTIENLITLSHEVGHALDYRLNGNKYPNSIKERFTTELSEADLIKELKEVTLYMRPTEKMEGRREKLTELMADAYSLYLLDPELAKTKAPNMTKLIEKQLTENADIGKVVKETIGLRSFVENPAENLDISSIRPVGEPRSLLPDDIVNPTEATKQLILNMRRTMQHKMSFINNRVSDWKKALPEGKREDIGAAVEKIGNLKTGKTYEQIMSELTPEERNILARYRYHQEKERQEVNKLLQSVGEQEYINYIEDYLNHQYIGSSKKKKAFVGKWMKNSPNAKKRVFPTLQEAVDAGLTPLTQDFAELHKMWGAMNWRVALNRAFVYELRNLTDEEGIPLMQKPGEAPAGWEIVQHPAVQQIYAKKNKDGTLELWHGGAALHPDVYQVCQQVFQKPFTHNIVKTIETVNSTAKTMMLTFSFFHHIALTESAMATLIKFPFIDPKVKGQIRQPFRGIVLIGPESETLGTGIKIPGTDWYISMPHKAGLELMNNTNFMRDIALESGTVLNQVHDTQANNVIKILRAAEAKTAKMPLVSALPRALRQLFEWNNRTLWEHLHSGLKAYAYYDLTREWLSTMPEEISSAEIREGKHKLGGLINDAFGGQEWERYAEQFWATPQGRQILHMSMLAPDWTISNARMGMRAGSAIYETAKRKVTGTQSEQSAAVDKFLDKSTNRYWRNMMLVYFTTVAILNFALNDRWPWENEPDHKMDVDVTNIMLNMPWVKDDGRRYYVKAGKQWREVMRYFTEPRKLLGAKASPLMHQAVEQATNVSLGYGWETPWADEDLSFLERSGLRLLNVVEMFKPFSVRGNQFALTFPLSRGLGNWKATKAMEEIIKAQVDPTLYERLMKKDNADKLIGELVDGITLNNLDADQIWRQANSNVRSKYYGKMWLAIDKENWKEADRIAKILLELGVEWDSLKQSGKTRGKSSEAQEAAGLSYSKALKQIDGSKLGEAKSRNKVLSEARKMREEYAKYNYTEEEEREINRRINEKVKQALVNKH